MKAMARTILSLLVLIALAPITSAFVVRSDSNGIGRHWNLLVPDDSTSTNIINRTTGAIRYALASDGCCAMNTAAELNAVRAAFAQWQAAPGTYLKFEDAGLVTTPVDINTSDRTNIVYWEKKSLLVNHGQRKRLQQRRKSMDYRLHLFQ
ncbi:MAG: hypothetical protein MUF81_15300 [Verrucomicrobia bacterium]|nr:hypothetical protein [Verrucomicrobiota bacterium]